MMKPQGKKNLWKPEEDLILKKYVETYGEGKWATVSTRSGLMRGGKSCRLRWKNYLRPNIKRGEMSKEEEDLIIRMHKLLGNRWSLIAGRLPGRTDNEVKNYWNTHLNKSYSRGEKKCNNSNSKNYVCKTENREDGDYNTKSRNELVAHHDNNHDHHLPRPVYTTDQTPERTIENVSKRSSSNKELEPDNHDDLHHHHQTISSGSTVTNPNDRILDDTLELMYGNGHDHEEYYFPMRQANYNTTRTLVFDDIEPFMSCLDTLFCLKHLDAIN